MVSNTFKPNTFKTNIATPLISVQQKDALLVAFVVALLFLGVAVWDHISYSQCENRAAMIDGSVDHEYGRGYFVRDHQGRRLDMGHF